VRSGPPAVTTSRRATFELAPGNWTCQLVGNDDDGWSRPRTCSGTFTVISDEEGSQTLKIRNADTGERLESWRWTIVDDDEDDDQQDRVIGGLLLLSEADAAAEEAAAVAVTDAAAQRAAGAEPPTPQALLPWLALSGLLLPLSALIRRVRARRS